MGWGGLASQGSGSWAGMLCIGRGATLCMIPPPSPPHPTPQRDQELERRRARHHRRLPHALHLAVCAAHGLGAFPHAAGRDAGGGGGRGPGSGVGSTVCQGSKASHGPAGAQAKVAEGWVNCTSRQLPQRAAPATYRGPAPPLGAAPPPQVVGFLVLLSGTSVYNEILRSCLPAAEPRPRRHAHRHLARGEALAGDAEAGLHQPLLAREEQPGGGSDRAGGSGGQKAAGAGGAGHTTVRFAADVPASRPIAAGRQSDAQHARYTMARCAWLVVGIGLGVAVPCTCALRLQPLRFLCLRVPAPSACPAPPTTPAGR